VFRWGGRRFDVDGRGIFGSLGFLQLSSCLDEGRWGPILKINNI
jgi:hypothetical protein